MKAHKEDTTLLATVATIRLTTAYITLSTIEAPARQWFLSVMTVPPILLVSGTLSLLLAAVPFPAAAAPLPAPLAVGGDETFMDACVTFPGATCHFQLGGCHPGNFLQVRVVGVGTGALVCGKQVVSCRAPLINDHYIANCYASDRALEEDATPICEGGSGQNVVVCTIERRAPLTG